MGKVGRYLNLRYWPLRKLLAAIVCAVVVAFLVRSFFGWTDIPENTADVLKWLFGIAAGGYVGSSSYEATHKRGGEGDE